MCLEIAIIYNKPYTSRYEAFGERKAIIGVMDEVDAVFRALTDSGNRVSLVPLVPPLVRVNERLRELNVDLVFNLFEGFPEYPESEGIVADLLTDIGLSFTGCNGRALSLCLDKVRAKALLESVGIETPKYQLMTSESLASFSLDFPCIVKPCAEDASHGISTKSVVNNRRELESQVIWIAERFGGRALVEEYVDGREFNVTVIGIERPAILPVSEIVYTLPDGMPRILTFAAKWQPENEYYNCSKAVCPAHVGIDTGRRIREITLSAFRILCDSGYARVDFRMDGEGNIMVIDVNPNPDISPDSGAVLQAVNSGLTYTGFIEKLIAIAFEQNEHQAVYSSYRTRR